MRCAQQMLPGVQAYRRSVTLHCKGRSDDDDGLVHLRHNETWSAPGGDWTLFILPTQADVSSGAYWLPGVALGAWQHLLSDDISDACNGGACGDEILLGVLLLQAAPAQAVATRWLRDCSVHLPLSPSRAPSVTHGAESKDESGLRVRLAGAGSAWVDTHVFSISERSTQLGRMQVV